MSVNETNVQTSVQQIDLDLDSWLGAPGAESIVMPTDGDDEKKPGMFSKAGTNLDFLNEVVSKKTDDEKIGDTNVSRETSASGKDILDEVMVEETGVDDLENENDKKAGRPKTDKSGLVSFLKKRIESKDMFAFDDYDEEKQDLEEYLSNLSEKDIDDLWQANIDNLKQEVASNTPKEFFESLPDELQYAAKYVMDGGQDLKGLFQALAQVEQVREMNPADENDQEGIVRSYLQATNFGSSEEIEEELNTWKDLGTLEKKAKQFKPKLDQMQEQIVQAKIAEQEERQAQQQAAAETYMTNVYEALKPAEINGLKLDKKTQAQLYTGLTQPQYPSISGRPTNLLGHLLEKYQFVEPNYPLIAEALWLLSEPEAYRQNLMKQGKNQAVEQTVRSLKTEQSRKTSSVYNDNNTGVGKEQTSRKISRPTNIFKR